MEAAKVVQELLERERGACAKLEAVLRAEREALTSFSAEGVSRCVREKDMLQRELASLADWRADAVRALGREIGVDADDGRLAPLLSHLPPTVAPELRAALKGLREALVQTRRVQRVNGALIDASLKLVGDLVQVYRHFLPGTSYDQRATVKPGPAPDAVDRRV